MNGPPVEPVEEIPSAESMETRLYNLMAERQEYANELYNTLSITETVPQYNVRIQFIENDEEMDQIEEMDQMEEDSFRTINMYRQSGDEYIPIVFEFNTVRSSFWDPVIVHLTSQQIENIQTVNLNQECSICNVEKDSFKKVHCCNNVLCAECCTSWFSKSVYCTFCRGDLRNHCNNVTIVSI
jgi:hypothetical protein